MQPRSFVYRPLCRKGLSKFDFLFTPARFGLERTGSNQQAALDGFPEIGEQFLTRVSLGHAAGQGGDFGPVTAFFGVVNK